MALRWAVATGVWSATGTWNGGTLPGAGDEVHAGGFTVTIDQDITVGSLSTHLNGSAAAGGGFVVSSMTTRAINANINGTGAFNSTTSVLTVSATSGTLTITGNVFASNTTASTSGIVITASGATVNITGNVNGSLGGSGVTNCIGITFTAGCTMTITGNVNGGTGASSQYGILCNSAPTLTVNGNLTASAAAAINAAAQNIVFTCAGTLTAATGGVMAYNSTSVSATTVLSGTFVAASDGTQAVVCTKYYVKAAQTITYTQRDDGASHLAVTISNLLAGLPALGDVRYGTTYGSGGTNTGTLRVPAAGSVDLGVLVDNTTGTAVLTASGIWNALTSGMTTTGSIGAYLKGAALSTDLSSVINSVNDHTDGAVAALATSANVTAGVASVWATLTSTLTTPGSIGERLKNSATVQTTGDQMAAALT